MEDLQDYLHFGRQDDDEEKNKKKKEKEKKKNKDKCVQEPCPKGNNNNFRYFVTCLDGANSETRHGGSSFMMRNWVCAAARHVATGQIPLTCG